jgi:hypothetical protein
LQLYLKEGLIYNSSKNYRRKEIGELNREVRGLAKLEVGRLI